MNRPPVRILLSAVGVLVLLAPSTAQAAPAPSAWPGAGARHLAAAACTGSVDTAVTATGVTTTGSVTCTGLAALQLASTVTAAGVSSVLNSPLTALPNLPAPIAVTVPAVNPTAGCATLVDLGSGAQVATSCGAAAGG